MWLIIQSSSKKCGMPYWLEHGIGNLIHLNNFVPRMTFTGCTRGVNGGLNGLEDREANLKKIKQILGG